MKTKIDTLREKEKMYLILKRRVDKLNKQEIETGKIQPELRETITASNALLREIRIESGGFKESLEEKQERVFGDWVRSGKKQSGRGEK